MATTQDLIDQYGGQLVPFSFHGGFVCLSYAISLIGTGSTLELMRRRTSHRGAHNLMLLIGAAISMGGIAIWSMHFIGNRAIYILDGNEDLQIAYSTGMTILSLLVPILVLLLAFVALSGNDRSVWWRIGLAGLLSGGAICGMHYLADASISNFQTSYRIGYVVGAAIIASSASTAALALFFVFEAAWILVWWKRVGCAMVLAGAVSGMHWCAAVGTSYRLLKVHSLQKGMSRRETLIMVICLSVAACIVLTVSGIYSGWIRRDYASKSQQVVLAAAVFDDKGRIMVNQEGYLPSEVVTDAFIPKSNNEVFDTTHPLFHWMFRASRNWPSIANLTNKMANHISRLSPDKNSRSRLKLVGEDGMLVPYYDTIVCELFSLAALALAAKTKEALTNAGTLWDEIFATGNNSSQAASPQMDPSADTASQDGRTPKDRSVFETLAERGLAQTHQQYGRGCLMFLVRHVDTRRDMDKLEGAGYRFVEVRQVVGSIRSSMQIKTPDFAARLRSMSAQSERTAVMAPGVHLGLFAVRARLDHCGFDVLVQKEAKSLLPTAMMPLQRLEPWQVKFLDRLRGLTIAVVIDKLDSDDSLSAQEGRFACILRDAISSMRHSLGDTVFDDSTLIPKVVQVPCSTHQGSPRLSTCTLIAFRIVLPIHTVVRLPQYEFIPLRFFRVQQLVYEGSPHHIEFSHMVHRELSSILHDIPASSPHPRPETRETSSLRAKAWVAKAFTGRRKNSGISMPPTTKSQEQLSKIVSNRSWPVSPSDDSNYDDQKRRSRTDETPIEDVVDQKLRPQQHTDKQLFGGIMVSQEIVVNVHEKNNDSTGSASPITQDGAKYGTEMSLLTARSDSTAQQDHAFAAVAMGDASAAAVRGPGNPAFIDELFALCMDKSLA